MKQNILITYDDFIANQLFTCANMYIYSTSIICTIQTYFDDAFETYFICFDEAWTWNCKFMELKAWEYKNMLSRIFSKTITNS